MVKAARATKTVRAVSLQVPSLSRKIPRNHNSESREAMAVVFSGIFAASPAIS
jgi:hypothetical protein